MSEPKQPPTNGQPSTDLAPAHAANPLADFFGGIDRAEVTSFNTATAEGRQLLQKCEEEPDKPLKELVNLKLRLKHVYAKRIELVRPETGELVPATRICLITNDGKTYTGKIVNDSTDGVTILTDPEDSTKVVEVKRADIDQVKPSAVSLMPEKLLQPLNEDEVLDLLAYLLSRGDPNNPMFKKEPPKPPEKKRPAKK